MYSFEFICQQQREATFWEARRRAAASTANRVVTARRTKDVRPLRATRQKQTKAAGIRAAALNDQIKTTITVQISHPDNRHTTFVVAQTGIAQIDAVSADGNREWVGHQVACIRSVDIPTRLGWLLNPAPEHEPIVDPLNAHNGGCSRRPVRYISTLGTDSLHRFQTWHEVQRSAAQAWDTKQNQGVWLRARDLQRISKGCFGRRLHVDLGVAQVPTITSLVQGQPASTRLCGCLVTMHHAGPEDAPFARCASESRQQCQRKKQRPNQAASSIWLKNFSPLTRGL